MPCDSTPFGIAGTRSEYSPFHGELMTFYPFGVRRIMNLPITNVHEGELFLSQPEFTGWFWSSFPEKTIAPPIPEGSNVISPDSQVGVRNGKRDKPRMGFNAISS